MACCFIFDFWNAFLTLLSHLIHFTGGCSHIKNAASINFYYLISKIPFLSSLTDSFFPAYLYDAVSVILLDEFRFFSLLAYFFCNYVHSCYSVLIFLNGQTWPQGPLNSYSYRREPRVSQVGCPTSWRVFISLSYFVPPTLRVLERINHSWEFTPFRDRCMNILSIFLNLR